MLDKHHVLPRPVNPDRLARYVLALGSLCKDPKRFYGHDLVAALQHHEPTQVFQPNRPNNSGKTTNNNNNNNPTNNNNNTSSGGNSPLPPQAKHQPPPPLPLQQQQQPPTTSQQLLDRKPLSSQLAVSELQDQEFALTTLAVCSSAAHVRKRQIRRLLDIASGVTDQSVGKFVLHTLFAISHIYYEFSS